MISRKIRKALYNTLIILLLAAGAVYVCSRFIHPGVEYTDNAQVRQHITPVNTRIQGFIRKICFEEYQPVHKGDTLLLIEDAEFKLQLAQAEANLANARSGKQVTSAGMATMTNNLQVNDAGIEEARVQLADARREAARYQKLLEKMPSRGSNMTKCKRLLRPLRHVMTSCSAPNAPPRSPATNRPGIWSRTRLPSAWPKPPWSWHV